MDAPASAPKIGKIIKRARERKRMTQAEAAGKLGVSRSALNAWENDRAYPRSSIGALEELYGIVIDTGPEPDEPQAPTQEDIDYLRGIIREVLGPGSDMEAKLDAEFPAWAPRKPSAGPETGRSGSARTWRQSG